MSVTSWVRKAKTPSFLFLACVLLVYAAAAIGSKPFFNESVFYLGQDEYKHKLQRAEGQIAYYGSKTGPLVRVQSDGLKRLVTIEGRNYSIGEKTYPPATLVAAAYSDYHSTRGQPAFLLLSLAAMLLGWCQFKYEKFQTFLFHLSFYRLWIRDSEPTDFYYTMTKAGGILMMIIAVAIAFVAYFI